jgi:hypothetical protein
MSEDRRGVDRIGVVIGESLVIECAGVEQATNQRREKKRDHLLDKRKRLV